MSTPIEEIKARLDIVDIVSETVQLRKSGNSYSGMCPFHANTRTPSFVVWPDSGTWRCFGACAEGGDVFKFVMKREGWDFPEALRNLAEKAGVQLRPQTPEQVERQEEHDRLRQMLDEAVVYYHNLLMKNPAGAEALDYLRKRHLSDATIAQYELGYSLPGWDNTLTYFTEKGYSKDELIEAGLVTHREDGDRTYDRFRHRIMFPIRDDRGRMAGFGARALDPDDNPKYLNSPQTPLFDKSALLYGLDKAKRSIRAEDRAVIVEGYMDVIAPAQAGFTNLVSPMGTALTPVQIRMLKRLTRNLVLALDADEAGMRATMRGLEVARDTLEREADPIFNAAGLVRHEGRLQANIRISTLPDGMDPDELVNQDPDAWTALIENAKPVVIHVMDALAAGRNLDDPKVKSEIAEQVLPLIQDAPNAIERDTYTQQLARLLKVDERSLLQMRAPRQRATRRTVRQAPRDAAPEAPPLDEGMAPASLGASPAFNRANAIARMEEQVLSIMMRQPELLYRVDRALQEAGLDRVSSQDFQATSHQELFRSTLASVNQDVVEPLNFAMETLPLHLADVAEYILGTSDEIDPTQQRVLEELMRLILQMRERNLNQMLDQIRFLLDELYATSWEESKPIAKEHNKINHNLNLIMQAIGRFSSRSVTTH